MTREEGKRVMRALRWLIAMDGRSGEYECGHGSGVLTGTCEESRCKSHEVRALYAAAKTAARAAPGTATKEGT